MKKIVFLVFWAILCISCQKETSQTIESGIYEAYQQGFSEIITVTKSSYSGKEDVVVFKSMEENFEFPPVSSIFDDLGVNFQRGMSFGNIYANDVVRDNQRLPIEYTLTVEDNGKTTFAIKYPYMITILTPTEGYNIRKNGNQIKLSPVEDVTIIRFSPKFRQLSSGIPPIFSIDDEPLIVTSKDKDYDKYTTIQGEIQGENIILYFYDARIKRGSSHLSQTDINYLDIDRIRKEMNNDDVLEFVRKAIYLKKKK